MASLIRASKGKRNTDPLLSALLRLHRTCPLRCGLLLSMHARTEGARAVEQRIYFFSGPGCFKKKDAAEIAREKERDGKEFLVWTFGLDDPVWGYPLSEPTNYGLSEEYMALFACQLHSFLRVQSARFASMSH